MRLMAYIFEGFICEMRNIYIYIQKPYPKIPSKSSIKWDTNTPLMISAYNTCAASQVCLSVLLEPAQHTTASQRKYKHANTNKHIYSR